MIRITLTLLLVGFAIQPAFAASRGDAAFERGKSRFERGKYRSALKYFESAIKNSKKSETRIRSYYYQGLVLFELGHYYSSYRSFYNVLSNPKLRNKKIYEKSIKNAVIISDRLGLVDRIGKQLMNLPGAYIATSVSHMANYAIGVYHLFRGRDRQASGHLKAVHPQSEFYAKSMFYLGVIATKKQDYKNSDYYFRKVYNLTRTKRSLREINELSRLNIARTTYSRGNIENSVALYSRFSSSSPYWLTVLLEASWPLMRANDTTVSLGNLHTLMSPFYRDDLVGEAYILRATILFSLCKYEEMRKTLALFFEVYDPVMRSLRKASKNLNGSLAYYNAFVTRRGLPKAFVNYALRDAGIKKKLEVQKLLNRERAKLTRYAQNSQMRKMRDEIKKMHGSLSREINKNLRIMLRGKLDELKRLREQANYLKVEVVTGEKDLIQQNKGLPGKRVVDVETSVAEDYHFYPYQGEYWGDELGTYVYTTASSCFN